MKPLHSCPTPLKLFKKYIKKLQDIKQNVAQKFKINKRINKYNPSSDTGIPGWLAHSLPDDYKSSTQSLIPGPSRMWIFFFWDLLSQYLHRFASASLDFMQSKDCHAGCEDSVSIFRTWGLNVWWHGKIHIYSSLTHTHTHTHTHIYIYIYIYKIKMMIVTTSYGRKRSQPTNQWQTWLSH